MNFFRKQLSDSDYIDVSFELVAREGFVVVWQREGLRTKSVRYELVKRTQAANAREAARRIKRELDFAVDDADEDDVSKIERLAGPAKDASPKEVVSWLEAAGFVNMESKE